MRITQTDILLWQRGWQRVGPTGFNRPQHWTHPRLPGARLMTREHLDAVQNNNAQLVEALKAHEEAGAAWRSDTTKLDECLTASKRAQELTRKALADATALTKGTL